MALAQMEGEYPALYFLDAFQDIGNQIEVRIVPDKPGVTVDHHLADIFFAAHQQCEDAAVTAAHLFLAVELGNCRLLGQTLMHRRQFARRHLILKRRRLDEHLRLTLPMGGGTIDHQSRR